MIYFLAVLVMASLILPHCSIASAVGLFDGNLHETKVQPAMPQAPRIVCNIKMQYWCVVQADSIVNMVDDGDYRVWSITSVDSKRVGVTVRENKNCDSASEFQPQRRYEGDDTADPKRRRHVVEFLLTADGACKLRVEYPLGSSDWAREAQQIANYRLFICNDNSCRARLLTIK
jgi:hypothetical protein